MPAAIQVADRFHLLVNLREALERLLQRQPRPAATDAPAKRRVPSDGRQELFDRVRQLRGEGWSLRRIMRETGLHYRTIERYLRSAACPDWNAGKRRPSCLDQHNGFLRRRLREGCRTAAQLGRELAARGVAVGASALSARVRLLRAELDLAPARPSRALAAAPTRSPSPRAVALAALCPARKGTREALAELDRRRASDSDCPDAFDLAQEFAAMARQRDGARLDGWLARAERCPALRLFAQSLRRDLDAVRAGLTLPWSNGPVEGAVHRLKLVKRTGYGRMGFDLLRARVLHAA